MGKYLADGVGGSLEPVGAIAPLFGDSIGRWEGDTFVIETTSFNNYHSWQDHPAYLSAGAKVTERFTRVAEDPFFALGNAVEARDLEGALGVLGRDVQDGASPFMLLGSLAGTVRRLVTERERARKAAGEKRIGSFAEWQGKVLPAVPEDELGDKKPYGFWMKYQASTRFARDAAQRYAREADFEAWSDRLLVYGLDLRHTPSVEAFCHHLLATHDRLDYVVNNACQTVRRPPDFYAHLLENEFRPATDLPAEARGLLRSHRECVAVHRADVHAQWIACCIRLRLGYQYPRH